MLPGLALAGFAAQLYSCIRAETNGITQGRAYAFDTAI